MRHSFRFDGHLHIPADKLTTALGSALNNNLDFIMLTDYDEIRAFNYLAEKKMDNFDVERVDDQILCVSNAGRQILVGSGEEVKTKEGHLLAWGVSDVVKSGRSLKDTVENILGEGGIVVFPHLYVSSFHGCGERAFLSMVNVYGGGSLALEVNGQIPDCLNANAKSKSLGKFTNCAVFGGSDIHGAYGTEACKVGFRTYSVVQGDLQNAVESLRDVVKRYYGVEVVDMPNTLVETLAWNARSLLKSPVKKIKSIF